MKGYLRAFREMPRDARLLVAAAILAEFAYASGIYGVIINLFFVRLGNGPAFVGLANSLSWLSLAAFSLPAGLLGRHWGPRHAMVAGLLISLLSNLVMPLVLILPGTWQHPWLIAYYMLVSVGAACFFVNSAPYLAEVTAEQQQAHVFSLLGALMTIGVFAGATSGGLMPGLLAHAFNLPLSRPEPYGYALFLAAALFVPSTLVLLRAREVHPGAMSEAPEGGNGLTQDRRKPDMPLPLLPIVALSLVTLLNASGEWSAGTFANVYLDRTWSVPTPIIGAFFALGQLLAAPMALVTPLLVKRRGAATAGSLALLLKALCLLLLALAGSWQTAGLAFLGALAAAGLVNASLTIIQQSAVTSLWRGTMSGAAQTTMSLGASGISLFGGYLITVLGYRSLFRLGAGLVTAAAVLLWLWSRKTGYPHRRNPGDSVRTRLQASELDAPAAAPIGLADESHPAQAAGGVGHDGSTRLQQRSNCLAM